MRWFNKIVFYLFYHLFAGRIYSVSESKSKHLLLKLGNKYYEFAVLELGECE